MSKRKSNTAPANQHRPNNLQFNSVEYDEHEHFVNGSIIPSIDFTDCEHSDSDASNIYEDDNNSKFDSSEIMDNCDSNFTVQSYNNVYDSYTSSQKKLEDNHKYEWIKGEYSHNNTLSNELFLSKNNVSAILKSIPTELFEYYFSLELKSYIIKCSKINDYDITVTDLEIFIGIIIFTMYNKRLSQKDYWSIDPCLRSELVASAMSRNKFYDIKSKIKFHELQDQNNNDRIYCVRKFVNIFRQNLIRFGIFETALSIDEMMVKFFGRSVLKQFIRGKPIRFRIKLWALCSASGYLFDFEIYCGKSSNKDDKLSNCVLGSRVVINLLQVVINTVYLRN
ncbi:piggyBac transposable element-derived protein 3-like [Phymastichus coffea]|uniref:piggyBac transposable element-derived protein 3-like n=1 Tax=Phymastichus coffea TaxID=108790 RepID=UPI00273C65EE|nr:piggyBac transposable element-derived protein 3-like [Phymastichus coffea]